MKPQNPFQPDSVARFVLSFASTRFTTWLLASIIFSSTLDLFGIAIIFPYLNVVVDPAALARLVAWLPAGLAGLARDRLLAGLSLFLIAAYLGKSYVQALLLRYQNQRTSELTTRVGDDVVTHLLGAEYAQYLKTPGSEMGATAFASPVHVSLVYRALLQMANELSFLFLLFTIFCVINPMLTLAALALLAVSGVALYLLVIRETSRLGRKQVDAENGRYRLLFSIVNAIRDIKVMDLTPMFADINRKVSMDFEAVAWRYNFNHALPLVVVEATVLLGVIGSVLGVVLAGLDIEKILPLVGVAAVTSIRVIPAFAKLFTSLNSLRFYGESVRRFRSMRTQLINARHVRVEDHLQFTQAIELHDICFWHGDEQILDHLDLCIKPGQSYGIVGPSGSGKSTLLDVFTGLQRAGSGRFFCDGKAFNPFASASLPRLVGYVPQTITLIDASIAFNIAFVAKYDSERMGQALRMAHLQHLVDSLPHGLDTPAGENGTRLSGGQRQRIGLARAFYHRPSILVLDEATSALDPLTEREIAQELAQVRGAIATIMVSHRISAVQDCDEIIVMDGGRIVSRGTHDILLKTSGLYAEMYRSQNHQPPVN